MVAISQDSVRGDDVIWLHPASPFVELREAGNKLDTYLASEALTLNSVAPLSTERVLHALQCLCRKIPAMRACLRQRQNKLWVCELRSPKVDFEVLEEGDWQKELEFSSHKGFNSHTGPMWRSRLIPDNKSPCPVPEVKRNYPYQYKLLFVSHLGLLGGTMNAIMNAMFLDLLNGEAYQEDFIGIHEFSTEKDNSMMEKVIRQCKMSHPQHLRNEIEKRLALHHRPLLVDSFKVPDTVEDRTRFETYDIGSDTFQCILRQCRTRGVTVNSFMIAILNASIVQMLRNTGIVKESYNVVSCHAVDGKRYLEGDDTSSIQNPFTFTLTHLKVTPGNVLDIFWDYTRDLHAELLYRVSQKQPLYERILHNERNPPGKSYEDFFSGQQLVDYDYYVSNISKTSNLYSGEGKFVQMTQIDFTNGIHKQGIPCFVMISTFRNRPRITVTYSTKYMAKETAQRLLTTVSRIIDQSCYSLVCPSHL